MMYSDITIIKMIHFILQILSAPLHYCIIRSTLHLFTPSLIEISKRNNIHIQTFMYILSFKLPEIKSIRFENIR